MFSEWLAGFLPSWQVSPWSWPGVANRRAAPAPIACSRLYCSAHDGGGMAYRRRSGDAVYKDVHRCLCGAGFWRRQAGQGRGRRRALHVGPARTDAAADLEPRRPGRRRPARPEGVSAPLL
eukprot:scaffold100054_cov66-Phaeocystis_antarctica.AAC.1